MVCLMLFSRSMNELKPLAVLMKQMKTKSGYSVILFGSFLMLASVGTASATQTWLAFRSGSAMHIKGGYTTQTIATTFGTNPASLPFAGTTDYDFYSPPMSADVSLVTSDKGGGVIYMQNTSATG